MFDINKHISIYIHFPWCVKKCPYCDFNSHAIKDDLYTTDIYYKKLIEDFDFHLDDIQGREIVSIFIGGGTPSLFKPEHLQKVLSHIASKAKLTKDCEITLEVNPGTVERGSIDSYQQTGINRISLGVQSLQDEKLKSLGRIHNSENVYNTVDEIHKSDISNFNIDIMHGLPNQSIDDGLYDISEAVKMKPNHLSWYQLTIEPNTLFAARTPTLPDEETLEQIEIRGKNIMSNAGYNQYEVSAYAKPDKYSRHNSNYWFFGDYIGIGAGAHSKITDLKTNEIKRAWKHKHPKIFTQANILIKDTAIVTKDDVVYEFMINALRLKQGFDIKTFEKHTFLKFEQISKEIQVGVDKGLLIFADNHVKATNKGYLFLNDCINLFV